MSRTIQLLDYARNAAAIALGSVCPAIVILPPKSNTHYEDLRLKHANFHRCAGDVVKKVESNDRAGAKIVLAGEFSGAAKETVTAIMTLKREIE